MVLAVGLEPTCDHYGATAYKTVPIREVKIQARASGLAASGTSSRHIRRVRTLLLS